MHPHRRRKKRPNYGIKTVDVFRGFNGFGFTISGQQPCILSSIVHNSPADLAGLRSGDFLISVNGLNVSKYPHENVVQLIGNSTGRIRMAIAENYYSDSSDEDILMHQNQARVRPKYPHTKSKPNRTVPRNSMDKLTDRYNLPFNCQSAALASHNVIHSPNATNTPDIKNVSAMVRKSDLDNLPSGSSVVTSAQSMSLEYRVIVGYLGTIEMPKQIATSSKLQTVRSCIRKMRQEKRNPTVVLMKILPSCLNLLNSSNILLATYPSTRLNYVSSSSDNNSKFFGLVTSAIYAEGMPIDSLDSLCTRKDIIISNSCHVFVIDTKLMDHNVHLPKADKFQIACTRDPISSLCLEFPNNSEYIVNLIRSMYSLKSPIKFENGPRNRPAAMRNLHLEQQQRRRNQPDQHDMQNSPQPSNHSEITTTSSNSDSGIGFHNDYANISDRILVVDFPGLRRVPRQLPPNFQRANRPYAIHNDNQLENLNLIRNIRSMAPMPSTSGMSSGAGASGSNFGMSGISNISHAKSKSADYSPEVRDVREIREHPRLAVRAMPDPIGCEKNYENYPQSPVEESWYENKTLDDIGNVVEERPVDVPASLASYIPSPRHRKHNLLTVRSCDDMMIMGNEEYDCQEKPKNLQASIDDITMLRNSDKKKSHVFRVPKPIKKSHNKKSFTLTGKPKEEGRKGEIDKFLNYKLSPKVFGHLRPISISFENLSATKRKLLWTEKSSDKAKTDNDDFSVWGSLQELRPEEIRHDCVYGSEPNLQGVETKQLSSELSPFKRWGQSSLRSRTGESRTLQRRPASLVTSDNDVYSKAIDDDDDFCSVKSGQISDSKQIVFPTGPGMWGQSFEFLLNDPAGIHTFAEFLKKEFAGENIFFWTACERYRQIQDVSDRTKEALKIFDKYLNTNALEPVNVDSQARTTAKDLLPNAEKDLFVQTQKQIFNLMKFDSYQRFIRSDLYKSCMEAEQKGIPLPYTAESLDPVLRISNHNASTSNTVTKLKKSLSNAEDRRRKSLLPWNRKVRCKSKDRGEEVKDNAKNALAAANSQTLKMASTTSISDIHSSRSSLSSFDTTISKIGGFDPDDSKSSLCRVILSNGATTIVQTKQNETIRELVERLLDKRGITYQAYEAFLAESTKPLELDGLSTQLSGKEVQIEQRVIFKLDLPNRKVISVKSKPCKVLSEVLRPILHKYNYRLDLVSVYSKEAPTELMDMTQPVTAVDGQRLQIVCNTSDEWHGEVTQIATTAKLQQKPQHNYKLGNAPVTFVRAAKVQSPPVANPQQNLDEITNKVFNELLQGKVEGQSNGGEQGSVKSEDWGSEASSGIFGRLRRPNGKSKKPAGKSSAGSEDENNQANQMKKPLIAKWKQGVKVQGTNRSQNDELLEGLKRAQRSRLEDQRGTEINFELPDFLKDKEKYQNLTSVGNKLRKTRFNESPSNSVSLYNNVENDTNNNDVLKSPTSSGSHIFQRPPQPAPRLSIVGKSPTKPIIDSSVQSKISNLENSIILNTTSPSAVKYLTQNSQISQNSRSNTPIDSLNLSTQCMASQTPVKRNSGSPIYNHPIYYSPDNGIYADTTMVFNHRLSFDSNGNSSFENQNEGLSYFSGSTTVTSGEHNDYQEIDDASRHCENQGLDQETEGLQTVDGSKAPPLPPKPKVLPIKPSNWAGNKEFKVPRSSFV